MNIEKIDTRRIIISLCESDMKKYEVTFESLNFFEAHSKKVISDIIKCASEKTGIDLSRRKIVIEALKYDKGCMLLVTVRDKRKIYRVKYCTEPYIFRFGSAEDFLSCIKALYEMRGDKFPSSAFFYKGSYYLAVRTSARLENKYIFTVNEFCGSFVQGRLFYSFLAEHAKPLKINNAVESIGRHL